jgi:hypothetical protein
MRCQRCGLDFENRIFINARGPSQGVEITGNAVRCPRPGCDGMAVQLVDGEYNVDDQLLWSLVRAVKPDGVTLGDYERALEAIRRGEAAKRTPEEIADDVVATAPVFEPGRRSWVRRHQGSIAAWVGAVAGVAAFVGDQIDRSQPAPAPTVNVTVQDTRPQLSDDDVAGIVRRELERHDAEQAGSQSPAPTTRAERRATKSRNAPCACGSGRKTKQCCGSSKSR